MPNLPLRALSASFPLQAPVTAIALDAVGARLALAEPDAVRVVDTVSGATIARLDVPRATQVAIGRNVLALADRTLFVDGVRAFPAETIAVDADTGEALAAAATHIVFVDSARRVARTPGKARSLAARGGVIALSVDAEEGRLYAWAAASDEGMQSLRTYGVEDGLPDDAGESMGAGITDGAEPCVFVERGAASAASRRKCLYRTTYRLGPRVITLMKSVWMDPMAISGNGLVTLWRRRALPELASSALVTAHAHDPNTPKMCAIAVPGSDASAMAFAVSKDGAVAAIVSEGAVHFAPAS